MRIDKVVINTIHLKEQRDFYHHLIGLAILDESKTHVNLGIKEDNQVLLRLELTKVPREQAYGLYHVAFLVSSRADLGKSLSHLIKTNTPLQGGADQGYSEAIYLSDLEGNGIEIYADRPQSEWHYDGDKIPVITEELKVDELLSLVDNNDHYRMPKGTKIGHMHLTVENPLKTKRFFYNLFNMVEKSSMGTKATWLANGDYHHHIAANNWSGKLNKKKDPQSVGLKSFSIKINQTDEWNQFVTAIEKYSKNILKKTDNYYLIKDDNGIMIVVTKE